MRHPDPGSKAKCPDYSAGRAIQSIHDRKNYFPNAQELARNCNGRDQKDRIARPQSCENSSSIPVWPGLFFVYLRLTGVQVRLELNLGQPCGPQLSIQCS